jgi:hypothetical protein
MSPVAGSMTSIVPPAQWPAISIIGFSLPIHGNKQFDRHAASFVAVEPGCGNAFSGRGATF